MEQTIKFFLEQTAPAFIKLEGGRAWGYVLTRAGGRVWIISPGHIEYIRSCSLNFWLYKFKDCYQMNEAGEQYKNPDMFTLINRGLAC